MSRCQLCQERSNQPVDGGRGGAGPQAGPVVGVWVCLHHVCWKEVQQGRNCGVLKQNALGLEVVEVSQGFGVVRDCLDSVVDEVGGEGLGADGLAQEPRACRYFRVLGFARGERGKGRLEAVLFVLWEVVERGTAVGCREDFGFCQVDVDTHWFA